MEGTATYYECVCCKHSYMLRKWLTAKININNRKVFVCDFCKLQLLTFWKKNPTVNILKFKSGNMSRYNIEKQLWPYFRKIVINLYYLEIHFYIRK